MRNRNTRRLLLTSTVIGRVALAVAAVLPAGALVVSAPAHAQDYSSGTLTGEVVDASGAPIAGAEVQITSSAQGFTRSATTDDGGDFRAALLPIGGYVVTITAPGYTSIAQSVNVGIGGQSSYAFTLEAASAASTTEATALGDIVVTAAARTLDRNRTTTGLTVNLEELVKTVPIGRDITSVVLLAPNAVAGDSAFGSQPSIGGSSVAENAFYLNGLNITNFDNYIGGSTVPYDFYRSVEVMTGGYSAEYGRSTGGIVNAISKSGTNEFEFALHGNWSPDALRETSPNTYSAANDRYEADSTSFTVEAGGPIIKDRLFFYGLAELRDQESSSYSITGRSNTIDKSDDPFYGAKVDAYITANHRLEGTYINTSRTTDRTVNNWDPATGELGATSSQSELGAGGESWVARYTGTFTDWLTISAAYGSNRDSNTSIPNNSEVPYAYDERDPEAPFRVSPGQSSSSFTPVRETERTFYRFDADLYFNFLGDHHLRAGYDKEETELTRFSETTGGVSYYYGLAEDGTTQAQGGNLAPGQEFVQVQRYSSGGAFSGENEAFYVTDSWTVNDQLTLNLGVRLDKFLINNADGVPVASFDEEIAPRIGAIWEPFADGQTRFYGSYGRYYLPVASNTAFRMGASELYSSEYFLLSGYDPATQTPYDPATGLPRQLGAQIVGWDGAAACPAGGLGTDGADGCTVTGDGTAAVVDSLIAQNLESTAQDEWIFGFERRFFDNWKFGAAYTYRKLLRNAEDVAIDAAVLNYCDAEGIAGCDDIWTGFHQYVIVNPGKSSTIILSDPLPGETELRTVDFSAQDLGYPEARRFYQGLELTLEREFDGKWGARGSWVVSRTVGNTEGYVKSDVGQSDAGITQDFDQPGLVDGAYGVTPNHRAHVFKLFGQYQVTNDFLVGTNMSIGSPRKFGCLGFHPTDPFANAYGAASYYCNGELTPRGSQLESDWTYSVDLSLRYTVPVAQLPGELVLRADIFNLFNADGVTDLYEFGETNGVGALDPLYGAPTAYQSPRYVRIGFDWQF